MKKNGRSKAPGWKGGGGEVLTGIGGGKGGGWGGGGVRGAYRNLVGESERRRPVGSS